MSDSQFFYVLAAVQLFAGFGFFSAIYFLITWIKKRQEKKNKITYAEYVGLFKDNDPHKYTNELKNFYLKEAQDLAVKIVTPGSDVFQAPILNMIGPQFNYYQADRYREKFSQEDINYIQNYFTQSIHAKRCVCFFAIPEGYKINNLEIAALIEVISQDKDSIFYNGKK